MFVCFSAETFLHMKPDKGVECAVFVEPNAEPKDWIFPIFCPVFLPPEILVSVIPVSDALPNSAAAQGRGRGGDGQNCTRTFTACR